MKRDADTDSDTDPELMNRFYADLVRNDDGDGGMTSRERVEAAFQHRAPDRTPMFEYVLLPPVAEHHRVDE